MNDSIIARRYAKALYALSIEDNKQKVLAQELKALLNLYSKDKNFQFLISNPVVKNRKKIEIFQKLFEGKVDEIVMKFLNLLINKSREEYLPDIIRAYVSLYQKHANIQDVLITSAYDMEQSTIDEIEKLLNNLSGKNSDIHTQVNSDLIGGFVLRVDNSQLDASVKGQLSSIKKQLSN